MNATHAAWLVLAAPLAGTLVIALSFKWLPRQTAGWIGTLAIAVSFGYSIVAFVQLQSLSPEHRELTSSLWTIARTTGVDASATILVDPLSVFMILVVSGVSMLIHLYSVSYLKGDRGYARFFAYLNYFVFSMLLLVLAGNFLLLIVGWAFVGAASYMLISFWYRRASATQAGIKAFVINVIGDAGLVLEPSSSSAARTASTSSRHFVSLLMSSPTAAVASRPVACSCSSGHSQSLLRFRCTHGCRTRWKDPRRCRR